MITRRDLGRVGVVANPYAGAGSGALRDVLGRLFARLEGADLVLNDGTFEAETAEACRLACTKVRGPIGDARRMAEALLDAGVDTVVGVGGDGTLGEIAAALAARESKAPLLGIGVGSSNVGPLVATASAGLDAFLDAPWSETGVHAVDVRLNGEAVGVSFHDVTPANTYFGTRDGRRVDLDGAAALRGIDRQGVPRSVCVAGTWIAKNGRRLLADVSLAGGQVVGSPLNDVEECRGKAVGGFLCWGPYLGSRALVAVASEVMIRTHLTPSDLAAAEPLRLFHIGLALGDVVELGGLPEKAVVVVDGTPRCAAGPDKVLSLRAMENAVVALRAATARPGGFAREGTCSSEAS